VLSWNLHGFSPDDSRLIFTGQRDAAMRASSPKVLNLYAIDLATRKETQLTTTPDGKRIAFVSNTKQ
jgi:TolB protein